MTIPLCEQCELGLFIEKYEGFYMLNKNTSVDLMKESESAQDMVKEFEYGLRLNNFCPKCGKNLISGILKKPTFLIINSIYKQKRYSYCNFFFMENTNPIEGYFEFHYDPDSSQKIPSGFLFHFQDKKYFTSFYNEKLQLKNKISVNFYAQKAKDQILTINKNMTAIIKKLDFPNADYQYYYIDHFE